MEPHLCDRRQKSHISKRLLGSEGLLEETLELTRGFLQPPVVQLERRDPGNFRTMAGSEHGWWTE